MALLAHTACTMSTLAQDKSIPSYCFLRPRPRFVDTLASQANEQPGAQRGKDGKDAAERGKGGNNRIEAQLLISNKVSLH